MVKTDRHEEILSEQERVLIETDRIIKNKRKGFRMALSKKKLIEDINSGIIWIGSSPDEKISTDDLIFDTVSIDLHLNNDFRIWKKLIPGENTSVDPSVPGFNLDEYGSKYTISGPTQSDGSFILQTREFVICTTLEYIKVPQRYFARIEGKSKLARLGLTVHNTAPTIQADWSGRITLEIYNHSPIPVCLRPWRSPDEPGLVVAQLIFEEISGELSERPKTFSSNQKSPLGGSQKKMR